MANNFKRGLIGVVSIVSLWAAIGSADPESAAAPDTSASAQESAVAESPSISDDAGNDPDGAPESLALSDEAEEEAPAFQEQEQFGLDFELASTNGDEMTELQFDTWAADFVGTEIGWHGQVERVDEALFGENEFRVVIDPRGGDTLERANLFVSRELALAIPQDAEVFFTGSIQEMRNSIGLTVEVIDVEIQDREGNVFDAVSAETSADPAAAGDPSIYDTFSTNADEMTEAQFDAWVSPIIGTEISWTGQVESVDESLFEPGVFEIVVDVDGGSGFGERARLQVTEAEALSVNQDASISFTGTLSEADSSIVLSLRFTDVTFTTS